MVSSRDVAVPAVWDVASAAGLRVASVGVPVTFPAHPIHGVLVGGLETPKQHGPRLAFHPAVGRFPPLLAAVSRWEKSLRDAFVNYANRTAAAPSAATSEAMARFEAMPRWKRAEALLLAGPRSLVRALAERHHVDLLALEEGEARPLWSSGRAEDGPPREAPCPPPVRSPHPCEPTTGRTASMPCS